MLVSCVTFICSIFCSCSTLLAPYRHARAQCEYKLIFALKFGNLALILPQTRIVVLNCNPITLNFLLAFSKVLQTFFSMKKYFFLITDFFCNLKLKRGYTVKTVFLSRWRFPVGRRSVSTAP